MGGWVVNATPQPLTTRKDSRYPLYRRLDGTDNRSGRVWKISPPPGFDPRTVQPVTSRYKDWTIRPKLHVICPVQTTQSAANSEHRCLLSKAVNPRRVRARHTSNQRQSAIPAEGCQNRRFRRTLKHKHVGAGRFFDSGLKASLNIRVQPISELAVPNFVGRKGLTPSVLWTVHHTVDLYPPVSALI